MKTDTINDIGAAVGNVQLDPVLGAFKRYGVAIISVCIAFVIRYALSAILGEDLPFTLFIGAALVAAWYGGAGTGIVALLLGLILADFFVAGPSNSLPRGDADAWMRIIRYVFTASLGIGLIEILHRARRRTEKALAEAREETERRKRSEMDLREAHKLLRDYAVELDSRVAEQTTALRMNRGSLQEILYNIAHCLRAPVRASVSFSQIFMQEYGPRLDTAGRDYIEKIKEAAEWMDALTRDLLEYGELAQQGIVLERVSLAEIVPEAVARWKLATGDTGAELSVEGTLPAVQGQAVILQQILMELLDNALKFSKKDVKLKIRIRAERCRSRLRVWVEDNGIGIDARYSERIFGMFEQVDADHTGGTGIGLAIVKQGMQRQGGDAGVESEPGVGSRFWLDFRQPGG